MLNTKCRAGEPIHASREEGFYLCDAGREHLAWFNLTCLTMVMFMAIIPLGSPTYSRRIRQFLCRVGISILFESALSTPGWKIENYVDGETGLAVPATCARVELVSSSWIACSNQHGRWRYAAGTVDSRVRLTTAKDDHDGNFN